MSEGRKEVEQLFLRRREVIERLSSTTAFGTETTFPTEYQKPRSLAVTWTQFPEEKKQGKGFLNSLRSKPAILCNTSGSDIFSANAFRNKNKPACTCETEKRARICFSWIRVASVKEIILP